MLYLKLALRNLIRNKTRTSLNLIMVVGAFSSIVFFQGFAHYMLASIEKGTTEGQIGHMQIASPAIWNNDLPDSKENAYIVNPNELMAELGQLPGVKIIADRANAYILMVNGDKSVGAQAFGYNPKIEPQIEKFFLFEEGPGFSADPKLEILIGAGLRKSLNFKVGQTISLISQTLAGSISSVDVEVRGSVKTGLTEVDNSTVYLPLVTIQKLLGTERAEKIVLLLEKEASLDQTLQLVREKLSPDLLVKSWKETATFFKQLTDFFSVQNILVEIILASLVFFGILNTLGMSIYERIGEIGTLRALGDHAETIFFQLVLEGMLLGIIGAGLAAPLSFLVAYGFSSLEIAVMMPGTNKSMPVHITTEPKDYALAAGVVLLTCLIATLWPVQKALRISVVNALRANS